MRRRSRRSLISALALGVAAGTWGLGWGHEQSRSPELAHGSIAPAGTGAQRITWGGDAARAYSGLSGFGTPVGVAEFEYGGAGRYFTGSLRDGLTCGVCHMSDKTFAIEMVGFEDSITPGERYELAVAWEGEATRVAFNAEIVGPDGLAAGQVEPIEQSSGAPAIQLAKEPPAKRAPFGCRTGNSSKNPRTESKVTFHWTAPDKTFKGPIWVHVSAIRKQDEETEAADPDATALQNDELAVYSASIPFAAKSSDTRARGRRSR